MRPTPVHEHGRHNGDPMPTRNDIGRDGGPSEYKCVAAVELEKKNQHVDRDDAHRNGGKIDGASRFIPKWHHVSFAPSAPQSNSSENYPPVGFGEGDDPTVILPDGCALRLNLVDSARRTSVSHHRQRQDTRWSRARGRESLRRVG